MRAASIASISGTSKRPLTISRFLFFLVAPGSRLFLPCPSLLCPALLSFFFFFLFHLRGWWVLVQTPVSPRCCFGLPPFVRRLAGGDVSQRLNSHDTATVFAPRSSRRPGTRALHDGDSHCCQKAAMNGASHREGFFKQVYGARDLPARVSGIHTHDDSPYYGSGGSRSCSEDHVPF